MAIQLPALDIQPPQQQPGAMDYYTKAVQLKSLLGNQQLQQGQMQLQQLEIKRQQDAEKDSKALTDSMQQWDGKWETLPGLVMKNGGSATAVMGVKKAAIEQQKSEAGLTKDQIGNMESQNDAILEAHKAVAAVPPEQRPAAYQQQLQNLSKVPGLDLSKFPPQYPGDAAFQQAGAGLTGSAARLTALAREKAAGKQPEGETPLPNVDQMNQAMASRYQVMNPGKALPAQFTLPAGATQKDFDRLDKVMTQTENAQGTAQNQQATLALRQQTAAIAAQTHADSVAQKSSKPVIAYDENNKAHYLPMGDAIAAGYKGITEATPKEGDDARTHTVVLNTMQTKLNDVMAARGALDQDVGQRAIISKVLSHSEPGVLNDTIRNFALKSATKQTKEYIQSALQLKETSLGLPKEITSGSRTSETQSSALFQTLPSGASVDSNYALTQGKKFQADIDRLRERAPEVRGLKTTPPHPDLGGTATSPQSTGVPANVSKALANTGPGIHKLSDGSSWMKAADGTITKQ